MTRSKLNPLPEYFDRYINLCDDIPLTDALQLCIDETYHFPMDKWEALGNKVYAPGKWTIKDILQHLIDTERIFTYRALAIARNETAAMPSFDEDQYALAANGSTRSLTDLIHELRLVYASFLAMYKSFSEDTLRKTGKSYKGSYSVADIGFTMAGHQRWHLRVLEDKYYPLIG